MRTRHSTLGASAALIVSLLALCVLPGLGAREPDVEPAATTYILVRHAEKASDGTQDPPLTEAGRERAERLASMLRSMGVAGVYSTDYARTRQTAAPIAAMAEVEPGLYDPRDPAGALARIGRAHEGGVVVLVGHSNTTPDLVRRLGGSCDEPMLADDAYDDVFVVVVLGDGRVLTHRLHS